MEDFIVPAGIAAITAVIGTSIAWVFNAPLWIGALVGAGITIVFFIGFYLALFSIMAGFAELLKGGK